MKGKTLGFILIALGIIVLLSNMGLYSGDYFLLMVGTVFLAFYFKGSKKHKQIGLLIPGLITIAIGLFANLEPFLGSFDGSFFFVFLGLAFVLIHQIHTKTVGDPNQSKWAMVVGFILFAFAGFILLMDVINFAPITFILKNFWPVALIAIGASMILRQRKQS